MSGSANTGTRAAEARFPGVTNNQPANCPSGGMKTGMNVGARTYACRVALRVEERDAELAGSLLPVNHRKTAFRRSRGALERPAAEQVGGVSDDRGGRIGERTRQSADERELVAGRVEAADRVTRTAASSATEEVDLRAAFCGHRMRERRRQPADDLRGAAWQVDPLDRGGERVRVLAAGNQPAPGHEPPPHPCALSLWRSAFRIAVELEQILARC